MSHKIKVYIITVGLFLLGAMQMSILVPNVSAAPLPCTPNCSVDPNTTGVQEVDCPSGKVNAARTECVALGNSCNGKTNEQCLKDNPITKYINIVIAFLSGLVAVIVVGVIILGGIQYSMAGDNSTAIQDARKRITNGLIALFAFLFIAAFLQWIVPGGL